MNRTPELIVEVHNEGTIRMGRDKYGTYFIAKPFHRAPSVTDSLTSARRWLGITEAAS